MDGESVMEAQRQGNAIHELECPDKVGMGWWKQERVLGSQRAVWVLGVWVRDVDDTHRKQHARSGTQTPTCGSGGR